MVIKGDFLTNVGTKVNVAITIDDGTSEVLTIGDEGLYFVAEEPITIKTEGHDDVTTTILPRSCSIRLVADRFIPQLYQKDYTTSRVVVQEEIEGETVTLFAGYLTPMTLSQGFTSPMEEVELNCIDYLGALQYSRYRGIKSKVQWDVFSENASNRSFADIFADTFNGIGVTYDNIPQQANGGTAMSLLINERLFLGDSFDDLWTNDKVVEAIVKYLNCYITTNGGVVVVRSLSSRQEGDAIEIDSNISFGTDHQISIGEVYSKIELNCDLKSEDEPLPSPLDDDSFESPFDRKQLYMSEWVCPPPSNIKDEHDALHWSQENATKLRDGEEVFAEGLKKRDWYIRQLFPKGWVMHEPGEMATPAKDVAEWQNSRADLVTKLCGCTALKLDSVTKNYSPSDTTSQASTSTKTSMIIGVHGMSKDQATLEADITNHAPRATYNGNFVSLSPTDDATTNYVVISGSVALQALRSGVYRKKDEEKYTVRFSEYYKAQTTSASPIAWADNFKKFPLIPFLAEEERCEYKYEGQNGYALDNIGRLPVLACMLRVGNKCVVENGNSGDISSFEWRQYKRREECASDAEYFSQCFYISIDPKIGDYIIGQEYSIRNNISPAMGIEGSGIAIPVKAINDVKGDISFSILGPVALSWDKWTDNRSWWDRLWGTHKHMVTSVPLLKSVERIWLNDFNVKVVSDNAGYDPLEEKDLVYVSAEDESFYNTMEVDFDICSALTANERQQLGVKESTGVATPINPDGSAVTSLRFGSILEKPEIMYVDTIYNAVSTPKIELEHSLKREMIDDLISSRFVHPALGDKIFYPKGWEIKVKEGEARAYLREC